MTQLFKLVFSAKVSVFKVLNNLLLKVYVLVFLGGAPTSIRHFFLPSVVHHISRTVNMIVIYGAYV